MCGNCGIRTIGRAGTLVSFVAAFARGSIDLRDHLPRAWPRSWRNHLADCGFRLRRPDMAFVAAVGDQTRRAMLGSAQSEQIDSVKRAEKLQQAYANRRVFIGMTADEIKNSWGPPARSNRSIY